MRSYDRLNNIFINALYTYTFMQFLTRVPNVGFTVKYFNLSSICTRARADCYYKFRWKKHDLQTVIDSFFFVLASEHD